VKAGHADGGGESLRIVEASALAATFGDEYHPRCLI
jgi:hypothetical protein